MSAEASGASTPLPPAGKDAEKSLVVSAAAAAPPLSEVARDRVQRNLFDAVRKGDFVTAWFWMDRVSNQRQEVAAERDNDTRVERK